MPVERPQLRPHLRTMRMPHNPEQIYLMDRLGLAEPFALSPVESSWLEFFDGLHTFTDIQDHALRLLGDEMILLEHLGRFVARLDEGMLLNTPRFQEVVGSPVRPPRCIGCYEEEPEALRQQLRSLFTHPRGAGLPRQTRPDGSLRAALLPHIDYLRGGLCYTYGFKELFEKSDAGLFVIIGTSHYSGHRFTLTRKNFQTPLGVVPTDQAYIDRLVKHYGDGLFDDEWLAHLPEHSIELEVVFLQFLYEGVRPIRIVPLVVGSFHDCVAAGAAPATRSDIARMIQALRRAEEETNEKICYVISGDLAHIGSKFNTDEQLDDRLLEQSYVQDQTLLRKAQAVDTAGFFRVIAAEGDERNICGLPPTYVTLEALQPGAGKVLSYDRFVDPRRHESVSFASVAFYD
jgi:MEMO1 family protein